VSQHHEVTQKLAKVFVNNSFANSYDQPAKRTVSYKRVPKLLHATSCSVMYSPQGIAQVSSQSFKCKVVTDLLIYGRDANSFD